MVDVAALGTRTRAADAAKFSRHADEIDQSSAGPQVDETQFFVVLLHVAAERVAVEAQHRGKVVAADHDVVETENAHRQANPNTRRSACRCSVDCWRSPAICAAVRIAIDSGISFSGLPV